MRVALAVLLVASSAHADSNDLITRPLVLAPGGLTAQLTVEYSLTTRSAGKPISLAPDAWYGVTDRWTLGVIHSNASVDRIDARSSICLRGTELTCDSAYRGSGIDVRYRLRDDVVPRARVLLRDIDPMKPAIALGALVRWTYGRFAVRSDPYLRFGLANRDQGNRAAFVLPVWIGFQPTCRWLLELHTGADGDLAVIRDGWHMPLSAVITARATRAIDVVVEAGFRQLYGPQIDIKERTLMVTVAYSR